MKITWSIDDGFAHSTRSYTIDVPDEDLEDLSEQEQQQVIDEYVRNDFENKIVYYWRRS